MAKATKIENAKLSDKEIKELAKVGVTGVKTVEDSRTKLIALLAKNEITDVDGESLKDLIEMYEAFYDPNENEEEEVEDEEEAEEEEGEEETEEDEDETEEEEEVEKDLKKLAKESEKKNDKKQKEVEAKKKTDSQKADAKTSKATKENVKAASKPAVFNPKEVAEDREIYIKKLAKLFPAKEYEYNYLAKGGCAIKFIGKNSKKVVVTLDSVTNTSDLANLTGDLYFNAAKGMDLSELLEDHELVKSWSDVEFIKGVKLKEIDKILTKEVLEAIMGKVTKADKTLAANREKMENNLKGSDKASKKVEPTQSTPAKKEEVKTVKKAEPVPVKKVASKKEEVKKAITKKK